MLDSLKSRIDLPVNFKGRGGQSAAGAVSSNNADGKGAGNTKKAAQKIVKNEEYYLDHCPVELVSILLKFVVE